MSAYLTSLNLLNYSDIIRNIAGIQLYVTTGIIVFVFYNFLKKIIVFVFYNFLKKIKPTTIK